MEDQGPKELWRHSAPETTRIAQFKRHISNKYAVDLPEYQDLHAWSLKNALDEDAPMFPRPAFFEGARLNFAENLLYPVNGPDETALAVIAATETGREQVTWRDLRERVRRCANAMRVQGIQKDDRVAGFLANHTNTLVAMLAATSIGALWTAVSPDTGAHAVLERLRQIAPKILFADNAVVYNGKVHEVHTKTVEIVDGLPELTTVVVFPTVPTHGSNVKELARDGVTAVAYDDFLRLAKDETPMEFAQLQPDQPVYILYSSGTTGKPKCIVHGAIGTLIQHKKEHDIHCDIRPGNRLFYFTTCTWMMWHWLVSGLASGATVILYDGSPFRPLDGAGNGEMAMPLLLEELGVTHFGTSAKYLSVLEQKAVFPKETVPLSKLRAIYSTGSPLAPSTFDYVYRAFGPDLNLGSITGGTDIVSLFGAPSLLSPVYQGEIQVRGLGMAVQVWDVDGADITSSGEPGDLVCVRPFPCQPVMFWGEGGHATYQRSYFERFPGVWHHGDFMRLNPQTGGLVMLGRSDGILKPAGVRFGSAEIYNVLLEHFPEEVADALCIGRRREHDLDETVVLFVKMTEGAKFTAELARSVQQKIRTALSARHVPAIVDECPEIPVTTNGKKVEIAVKQILSGMNIRVSASVANADCLDWYRQWAVDHP
ncbi:MAG: hypothetical protein M4579_004427 [Chaenotheca gracillima]|nr:MAG: hypothetical protein M4579_004427 [Chaenotheca gracillima]